MKIQIEHHDGKYPSFNVALCSAEGREPFVVIKGCRIVEGRNGDFVSWPARKQDDGKYWNHVYASEAFAQAVLDEARKGKPAPQQRDKAEAWKAGAPKRDDDDIPF